MHAWSLHIYIVPSTFHHQRSFGLHRNYINCDFYKSVMFFLFKNTKEQQPQRQDRQNKVRANFLLGVTLSKIKNN